MSLSRSAQTLVMIAATFSVVKATAATLTVLHTFQGKDDGGFPQGGLTFGPNGLLYGVTPNNLILRLDLFLRPGHRVSHNNLRLHRAFWRMGAQHAPSCRQKRRSLWHHG